MVLDYLRYQKNPTPTRCREPPGTWGDVYKRQRWMTKQSFWFNKGYLEHILGL